MSAVRWTVIKLHVLVGLRYLERTTFKGRSSRLTYNQTSAARSMARAGLLTVERVPRAGPKRDEGGVLAALTDKGRAYADQLLVMLDELDAREG